MMEMERSEAVEQLASLHAERLEAVEQLASLHAERSEAEEQLAFLEVAKGKAEDKLDLLQAERSEADTQLALLHATSGVLPRVSIIQMGKHNVKNPAVVFVLKRHGHEPFVGEYIEQVRVLETHHLVVQHCMFAWIVQ